MTELYDTICRIVEEKRAARRHPTIALSLEISQRTGCRQNRRPGLCHSPVRYIETNKGVTPLHKSLTKKQPKPMTKKELVDLIADKRDLSAQMVLTVVEDFMKIIQSSVADGQRIFLRGFGVFQPKERKAKVGRNITRGEQLSIPPKRVPQFRPYPHFKKVVEKGK